MGFKNPASSNQLNGNTLFGSSTAGGTLTLSSTSNAAKGKILFGTSAYDELNNRLGIDTQAPSAPLTIQGSSISDAAVIGSNLLQSTDFTNAAEWTVGAGWTAAVGSATHTAGGGTAAVTATAANFAATNGATYYVVFQVTGSVNTNQAVLPKIGTVNGPSCYGNATFGVLIKANAANALLSFAPLNTNWDGTIQAITIQQLTLATPIRNILSSSASTIVEEYGSAASQSYFLGLQSGQANTSGANCVGIGFQALSSNLNGGNNVAVGAKALATCPSGSSNVAIGTQALQVNVSGSRNVGIGFQSLFGNSSGNDNLAIGSATMTGCRSGLQNVAIGTNALAGLTNASNNVAIGYKAGDPTGQIVTTGANNTFIGFQASIVATATQPSFATAIGSSATVGANGAVALGTDHTGAGATTTTQDVIALGTSNHQIQVSNNATGAGSALLGANCPATTVAAPYTWLKMMSQDGSTVYVPAWK